MIKITLNRARVSDLTGTYFPAGSLFDLVAILGDGTHIIKFDGHPSLFRIRPPRPLTVDPTCADCGSLLASDDVDAGETVCLDCAHAINGDNFCYDN